MLEDEGLGSEVESTAAIDVGARVVVVYLFTIVFWNSFTFHDDLLGVETLVTNVIFLSLSLY